MPKSQYVDPKSSFAKRKVKFKDIPVCEYNKTIADEKANFSKEDFLGIYADMVAIREFETMLMALKKQGNYNDKEFTYPGPSHLAIGEESTAVGQAYNLGVDDFIFGTHRSHHQVIAKAMSAIKKLSDSELENIMKEVNDGVNYEIVKKHSTAKTVKDLARDFFMFGLMAELFAKDCGFSRGLGGSMHAFFLPFGIYPNNAIVGGSAPIATGVALYKKCNKKGGVVVANAGDGAAARGPVYESMNFAAMDQFNELWEDGYKGGLPIIFNFNNNHYGMGGQTKGETMCYDDLVRLAAISPSQFNAERINGWNPLAVIDAYKRKIKLIKEGKGPVLLDVVTYRLSGHSTSDVMTYRTQEEVDEWAKYDPLIVFPQQLVEAGVATQKEIDQVRDAVIDRNKRMFMLASDLEIAPYTDYNKNPNFLEDFMFSNQSVEKLDDRAPDVKMAKEDNLRVKKIKTLSRYAYGPDGKLIPKLKQYNIRDAIFESIMDKYYTDPTLISYGEDVRDWNGAFAVYRGLTEAVPYHRLFNSPISESAIVGTAVGYGMAGGRVIAELMYCDFIGCAGDEVFNQMAKWQSMSAGGLKMPFVLRVSVGSKYGAQHSQELSALCAHIPGLKVVFPVTPYDAKGMMNTALNGTDPVVFFESQRIYDMGERFVESGVPEGYYEVPFGEPAIRREGKDITILTIGATLYNALEAANTLEQTYGVSAEVIDARSVVPFNYEKVVESVKKTGRILLASDACTRGNILNDMAQNITQLAFDYLDAPPVVVGAKNWITPPFEYDKEFFPQPSWFIDAIHEKIMPLKGHVATNNFSSVELMRKAKKGV
ncbi:MAG: thiamine pyrophosphate-dependent enzyme [Oscillospiraceae bacterium]|jgi:2-oxoisovalerate dehydrogenase E1 component|nr:thiamine pyrophosphate-dependent enzyme [Oscillospiraceae bacterium]